MDKQIEEQMTPTKQMKLEPTEEARADIQAAHRNRLAMLAKANLGFGT